MNYSEKQSWKLVVSGADRRELFDALRESQWKDSFLDRAGPIDDDSHCEDYQMTFDIPDMDTLIDALKCIGHLKPIYGINLYCDADFGVFRTNATLSTKDSGFSVAAASINHTIAALDSEASRHLRIAEKALSELRSLVLVKERA